MKVKDIVKLIEGNEETKANNIAINSIGIIVQVFEDDKFLVAFLDMDKKVGEGLAIVSKEQIQLYTKKKNLSADEIELKYLDYVELIVEDERYSQYDIHKGARGTIVSDNENVDVLVDFTGINVLGKFYGDTISVKSQHLKLIKRK